MNEAGLSIDVNLHYPQKKKYFGHYRWATNFSGQIAAYNFVSFLNPNGSARQARLLELTAYSFPVGAASGGPLKVKSTISHSAGTLVGTNNIRSRHVNDSPTLIEIRDTNPNITANANVNEDFEAFPQANTMSAAGNASTTGRVGFTARDDDDAFVFEPGNGFVVYTNAAGDVDQRYVLIIDWKEVVPYW